MPFALPDGVTARHGTPGRAARPAATPEASPSGTKPEAAGASLSQPDAQPDGPSEVPLAAEPASGAPAGGGTESAEADPVQAATSDRAAPASTAKSESAPSLPRPVLSAAWLQRLSDLAPRAAAGSWQTVRLSLGEGEGELTVQARRDDERVAVTVQFSDPRLRSLAADHAERLLSALEARYDADVDLSFAEHDGSPSREDSPEGERALPSPSRTASSEPAQQTAGSTPTLSTGRNEWIG